VKLVVESYPNLDVQSGHVCSFIVFHSTNPNCHSTHIKDICHSDLCPWDGDEWAKTYDQLITSYPAEQAVDLMFFDFMKNVMYKKWSKAIHLEYYNNVPYIRVDLKKIPANVLYNFCICSRTIVEWREYLDVWQKLCACGIDPRFAFAVCRCDVDVSKSGFLDQKIKDVGSDKEHWPVYLSASLERLCVSGPDHAKCPSWWRAPHESKPTNIIWGETKDLRKLAGKTIREFWNEWKEKIA
jgi:hypothetical protein